MLVVLSRKNMFKLAQDILENEKTLAELKERPRVSEICAMWVTVFDHVND